jgi:hypothetical protein
MEINTWLHHETEGAKLFRNIDVTKGLFDFGWRDSPDRFSQSAEAAWEQWQKEKGPHMVPIVAEDEQTLVEVVTEAITEAVEETIAEAPAIVDEAIGEVIDELSKKELLKELKDRKLKGNQMESKKVLAERLKKAMAEESVKNENTAQ